MAQVPQVRLHLYHAAEAPLTVILLQGPTRQTRMILWDRSTDSFTDGQWLKHKIYYERCDLSPDGQHFLYFTLDGQWAGEAAGSYTVISRPPYFTALALYPQGDTWGGGGYFTSASTFAIRGGGLRDIVGRAAGLRLEPWTEPPPPDAPGRPLADRQFATEAGRLFEVFRQADDGWRRVLLRDFTDMRFEEVRAPYDDRAAPRA